MVTSDEKSTADKSAFCSILSVLYPDNLERFTEVKAELLLMVKPGLADEIDVRPGKETDEKAQDCNDIGTVKASSDGNEIDCDRLMDFSVKCPVMVARFGNAKVSTASFSMSKIFMLFERKFTEYGELPPVFQASSGVGMELIC